MSVDKHPSENNSRWDAARCGRRCPLTNIYRAFTIGIGVAVVLALGQILTGQAPAQGSGAAAGQPPGGRGGAAGAGQTPRAAPIARGLDGRPDLSGYWIATTKTNINNG